MLLQYPHGTLGEEMITALADAGREGGATFTNGIDPAANDAAVGHDEPVPADRSHPRERVADYSVYHQGETCGACSVSAVHGDAAPAASGMLAAGWGSVVRQIAAALDVTLDEPLVERHERVRRPRPVTAGL